MTLHSLARTVVARSGRPSPVGGDLLLELYARRFAREERRLADPLGGLSDGFASVALTVRDLLDAGFEPIHAEAFDEVLTAEGPRAATPEAMDRARALVRITRRTAEELERHGSGGPSELLRSATDAIRADPVGVLPEAEILVHGFADATGLATDLLQIVLERCGGTVYLDQPPDPAGRGDDQTADSAQVFGRRFRERLLSLAEPEEIDEPLDSPVVERFRALGEAAEVRGVAERILPLLESGTAPETIAIVARDLGPYGSALRVHLGRLGIPFSGGTHPGPPHPATRRISVLLELLETGDRINLEGFLDLLAGVFGRTELTDLRLAGAAGGWRRLRELTTAGAAADPSRLKLQVFDGLEDRDGESRPARRPLDPPIFERLQQIASGTVERLTRWPRETSLAEHLATVEGLVLIDLGWEPDEAISKALFEAFAALRRLAGFRTPNGDRAAGDDWVLSRDEFRLLLRRALEDDEQLGDNRLAGTPLGGDGSGIQVLSAVEARGRTAEHLFLIGLNRGRFPRTVREDPLLPDELRQVLGREGHGLLPDLESKRTGHFEERFLFAQLLSAGSNVTLSWLEVDDDGSRISPSPLVERLRWSAGSDFSSPAEVPIARPIIALDPAGEASTSAVRPRSAYEAAIVAGLVDRTELARLLPLALSEASGGAASDAALAAEAEAVAAARLAILEEWDPPVAAEDPGLRVPGPFLGSIGPPLDDGDPRRANKLWVTTLEGLGRCPWQTFLGRTLGLESLRDPLDGPPRVEGIFTGSLVHRTLEWLVGRAGGNLDEFATGDPGEPTPLVWPAARELDRALLGFAETLLRREGIAYPGFAQVLVATARARLDIARELEGLESEVPLARTAEIRGSTELQGPDGSPRCLHFKADRADRFADGLRLTDFKTGKPPSNAKQAATRRKHLLARIAAGQLLQAPAYAAAAATHGALARGRYLHLYPNTETELLVHSVEASDRELHDSYDAAAATLVALWEAGVLFPRLEQADTEEEPTTCTYCTLKEACARGDSGVRRRLREWYAARFGDAAGSSGAAVDQLLAAGWALGGKREGSR